MFSIDETNVASRLIHFPTFPTLEVQVSCQIQKNKDAQTQTEPELNRRMDHPEPKEKPVARIGPTISSNLKDDEDEQILEDDNRNDLSDDIPEHILDSLL